MRNLNESNITAAVVAQLAGSQTPRLQQISASLVRHLHNFIREVEPTQKEWEQGIAFLTRTGQMCSAVRQEFILFSDALGASMLVDAINHRLPSGATETTVFGPFFVEHAPEVQAGDRISAPEDGPPLLIEGRVLDLDGKPIAGAVVDIWHADEDGFYDVQKNAEHLSNRARVKTDEQGQFHVLGSIPSAYPIPADGPVGDMLKAQGRHPYRPAHVHFMIAAPEHETLVTHLFLASSDYLDSDVVFGVKDSLIEPLQMAEPGQSAYGARIEQPMQALRRDFVLAAVRAS